MTKAGSAKLHVLDVGGRLVRTLHEGAAQIGDHTTRWDLRDANGARVAPGLYFARLESTGQAIQSTRIVVTK